MTVKIQTLVRINPFEGRRSKNLFKEPTFTSMSALLRAHQRPRALKRSDASPLIRPRARRLCVEGLRRASGLFSRKKRGGDWERRGGGRRKGRKMMSRRDRDGNLFGLRGCLSWTRRRRMWNCFVGQIVRSEEGLPSSHAKEYELRGYLPVVSV